MFDPDSFLQSTQTEAFDTKYTPIPNGEYIAVLDRIDKPRTAKDSVVWDLHWLIDDSNLKAQMGREKITARQSLFLDVTPEGRLDVSKGKNVQLGKLRDALGQNVPGQAWSPSMMQGKAAKIRITQKVRSDGSGDIDSNVTGVAAL